MATVTNETIFVTNGTVAMNNDAAISDNLGVAITISDFTGGPRPTLTMSGRSRIANNQSKQPGGAGLIVNSDVIMGINEGDAPVVTGNRTPEFCGGLLLSEGSTLTMRYDAEISDNFSPQYAGGLLAQQSTINMHDNAVIKNNESNGAGLYLDRGTSLVMGVNAADTPSITGNRATSLFGGIFINQNATADLSAQSRITDTLGVNGIGTSGMLRISQNIQIADGLYFNSLANAHVIVQALGENASIQLGSTIYISPENIPVTVATKGDTYAVLTDTDSAAFLTPVSFASGTPIYLNTDKNQVLLGLVMEIQGVSLTIIRIA